jgi:chemotaxis signal transduction protein
MAATSIISPLRADKPPVETLSDKPPVYRAGKYLTFRVARQELAINSEYVRGILPMHEMVAFDGPSEWIRGYVSVGGRDVPVIDLRAKLGITHGSHGRDPFVIVVETEGRLIAFVADYVSEVLDLRQRDFWQGAIRIAGRQRRILDPAQIMSKEDWPAALIP